MDKLRELLLEKYPSLIDTSPPTEKYTMIDQILQGDFYNANTSYKLQEIVEQMVGWCGIYPEIISVVARLMKDLVTEYNHAILNNMPLRISGGSIDPNVPDVEINGTILFFPNGDDTSIAEWVQTHQYVWNSATEVKIHCLGIRVLPLLPPFLRKLDCSNNRLSELPYLPRSLVWLNCEHNRLETLPDRLPDGLTFLNCCNNRLKYLPQLPNGLAKLYCSKNLLTAVPKLPSSLQVFSCRENERLVLPDLPPGLIPYYSDRSLICYRRE